MVQKEKKSSFFTRGSADYIIMTVVFLILALGMIMVLSASAPSALSESGNSYSYFKSQARAAVIGLVAMWGLSIFDYRLYKPFSKIIYIVCMVLLVAVAVIGISEGGATRWISIGGFNFQPSEYAKIGFIIFFAAILTEVKKNDKITSFKKGFILPLLLLMPIIWAIFVLQNHFSATLLICAVTCIQMFIAGVKLRYFVSVGGVGLAGVLSYLLITNNGTLGTSFRAERIETWLDPFSDPTGAGWQIINSLYAIASGGLFGAGLGESKQKYLYLPEPHNDFIFAVVAEELGFFGCVVVILLFTILIWRGIVIAMKAPDTFGSLIAIGIVSLIGLQAIINIAVVTGTIPVTGMPLPFFSYGGTALTANLMAIGILLNISRASIKK